MPKINRRLIEEFNLADVVTHIIDGGLTDPSAIANKLNNDPAILALVKGHKAGVTRIMPGDVKVWLEEHGGAKVAREQHALRQTPEVKEASLVIKDTVGRIAYIANRGVGVAESALNDFHVARDQWLNGELDPESYPAKVFKVVKDATDMITKLHRDVIDNPATKQVLNAETVNVTNGKSDEEVNELLIGLLGHAGFSQQEALRLYSEFLLKKSRKDIIDA